MRIGLTSIYVDDQDQAERFYTQVLGFNVKTSAPYSNTERWLSVVSPEEPDGVELVLHLAGESARAFQQASRQNGRPLLSLATGETAPGRLSGSRPAAWRSPRSQAACPMAASTQCSTTPAATSSTCTRTDRRSRHAARSGVPGAGPGSEGVSMLLEDRNAVSYGPGGAVDGGAAAAAAQRGGVCSPGARRPGTMAGFRDRHRPPCRGAGDVPGRRTGGARHIGGLRRALRRRGIPFRRTPPAIVPRRKRCPVSETLQRQGADLPRASSTAPLSSSRDLR